MSQSQIECIKFVPYEKNYLIGFAELFIPKWQVEIKSCGVYEKNGSRWVSLPNKEVIIDGKEQFAPIIKFRDFELAKKFGQLALEAVDEYRRKNNI